MNFGLIMDLCGIEIVDDRGFMYMVWYLLLRYGFFMVVIFYKYYMLYFYVEKYFIINVFREKSCYI